MEAADSGARQSRHSATSSEHKIQHPPQSEQPYSDHRHHPSYSRDILDRPSYREPPAMATATLINPSSHYQSQPPFSSYSQSSSGAASISNMISSVEPRKPADDHDQSNRQSLPSISEVIQGTKPGPYPVAHAHGLQAGSSLPSPFAPAPRSFPEAEKRSSPQPLHPNSSFPRQDGLPAFADSPRPHFNSRPSLPSVSDRRQSPSGKPDMPPQHHHHPDQKLSEPHHPLNGVYAHPPPPPPPAPVAYQPGQLPAGQMPLPAYPISPRHAMPPHATGPYDPRAPTRVEESDYAARARYEATVDRHFESWSYQDSLSRIGSSSRTIFNFAEAYSRIAQEQHGAHPIPARLPTEREVSDMLSNIEHVKQSLEQVRDLVQTSIQNERAREGAKMKGPYDEEHEVSMYGDGMKPQYGITEVKKRRGRAAPPGRCHSCNRIDTPEWRRGPDGARTLCNACGLHYAKLERKRQLEARSIRPKPEEAHRQ
ncbi:hypothetical protein BKA59DRAFT_4521 [Fusarium tricinctum]|uniref:GATA-type domain-containing protein n=1 Tax=Fusarium tricinctum TaxID=61284 RepID=A0A8K0S8R5_9HYPO|nr:hypothetical protein BKA59DRAFT_4521 [Fusarium tricinctum]